GPARAGDADDRRRAARTRHRAPDLVDRRLRSDIAFEHGDRSGEMPLILHVERPEFVGYARHATNPSHDVLDHPDEPHLPTIFRRVDLLDPVRFERRDLMRRDGAATPHDDADVIRTELAKH